MRAKAPLGQLIATCRAPVLFRCSTSSLVAASSACAPSLGYVATSAREREPPRLTPPPLLRDHLRARIHIAHPLCLPPTRSHSHPLAPTRNQVPKDLQHGVTGGAAMAVAAMSGGRSPRWNKGPQGRRRLSTMHEADEENDEESDSSGEEEEGDGQPGEGKEVAGQVRPGAHADAAALSSPAPPPCTHPIPVPLSTPSLPPTLQGPPSFAALSPKSCSHAHTPHPTPGASWSAVRVRGTRAAGWGPFDAAALSK
jgi:hypothetical protein